MMMEKYVFLWCVCCYRCCLSLTPDNVWCDCRWMLQIVVLPSVQRAHGMRLRPRKGAFSVSVVSPNRDNRISAMSLTEWKKNRQQQRKLSCGLCCLRNMKRCPRTTYTKCLQHQQQWLQEVEVFSACRFGRQLIAVRRLPFIFCSTCFRCCRFYFIISTNHRICVAFFPSKYCS